MKKIIGIFLISIAVILFFIVKNGAQQNTNSGKLYVSSSFYPMYFFSSEVGKDKVDIKNVTPAGSEPHDYDLTTQDIAHIEKGNMLVLNGGVEAWANKIKENLKATKVKIVVAGEGLLTQNVVEEGKSQTDPHVWLDPILAKREVKKITDGYVLIDSKNANYYKSNEALLDTKLNELDKEYRDGLRNCKQKDVITSHAAFGYLANRYGLNQVPISGLSPDAEPSSQQLAEIVKFAKEHNVKYIFFESLVSPKLAQTIASEIGAKILVLDPIEGIPENEIKQGKNYFSIMQNNLKNLKEALQCN